MDILLIISNFVFAGVAIFSAFKLWKARSHGKDMSELSGLKYLLIFSILLLWLMNFYIGFVK